MLPTIALGGLTYGALENAKARQQKLNKRAMTHEVPYRSPERPYIDISKLDPVLSHRYVHANPVQMEYGGMNGLPKLYFQRGNVRYVARTTPERISQGHHR